MNPEVKKGIVIRYIFYCLYESLHSLDSTVLGLVSEPLNCCMDVWYKLFYKSHIHHVISMFTNNKIDIYENITNYH